MQQPVVIIGIGEIGSVFARGFLRAGVSVIPATRSNDIHVMAAEYPDPPLVMVAVGEAALGEVLNHMPTAWRERLVLLQNELLPAQWEQHGIANPTVISVWFEKKPGQDVKVVVPSPVYGPQAAAVIDALSQLDIPAYELASETELLFELVRKNYYILASNICGLKTGGTVSSLWAEHQAFARDVLRDIHAIQGQLTGAMLNHDALIAAMVEAFAGDPEHKCMGRSAPARLARALEQAKYMKLSVPTLQRIAEETAA